MAKMFLLLAVTGLVVTLTNLGHARLEKLPTEFTHFETTRPLLVKNNYEDEKTASNCENGYIVTTKETSSSSPLGKNPPPALSIWKEIKLDENTPSESVRKERGVYGGDSFGHGFYGEDDVSKHLGHKDHEEYGHTHYGGHKDHGEAIKGGFDYGSEHGKKHGYSKGYSKGYEHKYDHQYGQDFGHQSHHGHKDHNYHDYGTERQKYGKGLHLQHAGYGNQAHSLHHGHQIYPHHYGYHGYRYHPQGYHRSFHGGLLGLSGGIFGGFRGLGRLHGALGWRRPGRVHGGLSYFDGGSFWPGGYFPLRY